RRAADARHRARAHAKSDGASPRRAFGGSRAEARGAGRRNTHEGARDRTRGPPRRAEPRARHAGRAARPRHEQGHDRLRRDAARGLGRWRLSDCALYVTVEPCAMCAGAAVLARIALVVFGAPDEKAGAVRSVAELLDATWMNHRPRWRLYPQLRDEVERLLSDFFVMQRKSRPEAD